ncbi:hypothetical protein FRC04_011939 [Tulasnella sp. 424]|nr:hypothetical protein FRC04_011939 [Tulasnella sp. 424]
MEKVLTSHLLNLPLPDQNTFKYLMAFAAVKSDRGPKVTSEDNTILIVRPSPSAPLWPPFPDEIGDEIFRTIFRDPGPIAVWRARLQQCCRRWYWYIEDSPEYWTRITEIPPPSVWEAHLAKSQSRSLQVYCTTPATVEVAFMLDLVKGVLDRVEHLHCTMEHNPDLARPVEDFFTPPETLEVIANVGAPLLQRLELRSNRYCPYIVESLFGGITPELRAIHTVYVSIPWFLLFQLQRLETVVVDCAPHLPSPFAIINLIETCPKLAKLHIYANNAQSFVVIEEPVWYQPIESPSGRVVPSSLQSFVAVGLPVPGLHFILEHLSFPPSTSVDIAITRSHTDPTPTPIDVSTILSDVVSATDGSRIKLLIEGPNIQVQNERTNVQFCYSGNYQEVLLAVPPSLRSGVTSIVVHRDLLLPGARELFAAVTSLFPSVSEVECWCGTGWADLLTGVGKQLPNLQKLTLIFPAVDILLEPSHTLKAPSLNGDFRPEILKELREVCSNLPRIEIEGYELHGDGTSVDLYKYMAAI